MPGLVGVIDAEAPGGADALLSRMLGAIKSQDWHQDHRASDPRGAWSIGRVDLGFGQASEQPARLGGTEAICFFSGRLHLTREERRRFTSASTADSISDGELILRGYEEAGGRLPPSLRGSFSVAIVDPARYRVLIANDTIGQRPIYYFSRGSRLLFGSAVEAILQDQGLPREINDEAVSDMLEYRYLLGDKTLFRDIFLLSPGDQIVYDLREGASKIQNGESIDEWFSVPTDSRRSKVFLDELAELFALGTQRICDSVMQNTVALSGGMDSRAIMSVIQPESVRINSFTAGLKGSVDKKLSRRIAKTAGCESVYSEWTTDFLKIENYVRLARNAVRLTDGMRGSSFHPMTMTMAEEYHKANLKLVMTGHGGEFAKLDRAYGFSLNVGDAQTTRPEAAKEIVFSKMSWNLWGSIDRQKLFRGSGSSRHEQAVRASFDREFAKIDASLPVHQKISYFFLHEFFRKHAVLSNRIHANFSEIEYPFVAEDFLKAVIRVPLEARLNHEIHRHIIQVHNASLLRIPLSDTRVPLDAGRLRRLLVARPYGIARRLGFYDSDVPEVFIPRNIPLDVFDSTLLSPRCLDRGELDGTYLRKVIERFRNGEEALFHPLNDLFGIELWKQLYVDH